MIQQEATIRALNEMESAFTYSNARLPLCVVCVLHLQQVPREIDWPAKLHQLQERYPLLRSGITERKGTYVFTPMAPVEPIPIIHVNREHADSWKMTATTAVNTIFAADGPLMKCWHVQSATTDESELIICFHHAIIDGAGARLILHEILCLLGGVALPEPQELKKASEFPPPYRAGEGLGREKLNFFTRQFMGEWKYLRRGMKNPIPPHSENGLISLHLNRDLSRKLSVRIGREGLSLNSVLLAAIAQAVIRHRYPNQKQPLARVLSFANLRSALEPEIPKDVLGCYISMLRLTVETDDQPDLLTLAHRIRKAIFQASRRGEVLLMSLMSPKLVKLAFTLKTSRLGIGAISFIGRLDLQPAYDQVQLKHVRAFITNNQYGPEFSAFGKILFGCISLDLTYLTAETSMEQAARMVEEIRRQLKNLAE